MSDLPDPAVVSACAALSRGRAEELRVRAARLGHAAEACGWAGPAARAFRVQAEVLVACLRSAAAHLDEAADRLDRHAVTVRAEVAAEQRRRATDLEHLRDTLPPALGGKR